MTPNDITAGELWACKYRTTRMIAHDNRPVIDLKIGEAARGPQAWESVGVITTRDRESQRLQVVDIYDHTTHIVNYEDVWEIDRAVMEE
jgi:hypothetical protein